MRDGIGICLALSGGGMRAAAFHAGVLERLDEGLSAHDLKVEGIDVISAVSKGSITAALYSKIGRGKWKSEGQPLLKTFLAGHPVKATVKATANKSWSQPRERIQGIVPIESFIDVLNQRLFRRLTFSKLPDEPYLVIIAKNFKNGDLVKFTKITMRSYEEFEVAKAIGASSALPVIFNSVNLRDTYIYSEEPDGKAQIRGDITPLFDGGIHDNLALDPLLERIFSVSSQQRLCDIVIISNATQIPFDKEHAAVTGAWDAANRGLDLLMDRMSLLQWRNIKQNPSSENKIFPPIDMPMGFNAIDAKSDLSNGELQKLIKAGIDQTSIFFSSNGSRLRGVINKLRENRHWKGMSR